MGQRTRTAARGHVTLGDIAAALGISKATVSLAINGDPRVAAATRERVLAKSRDMGYSYNRGAAGLSTGRTRTIGLAVHNLSNPYFTEVCAAIEAVLSEHGRLPFLCNTAESLVLQHRFIEALIEYRADGLILCPADATAPADLAPLAARSLATVLIARDIEGSDLDFVGNDEEEALRLVTGHLIALGHRRIALIGGGHETSVSRYRHAGFQAALKANAITPEPALVVACPISPAAGEEAIGAILRLAEPPSAVVCFADLVALGVLSGLHRLGRRPGRDIAVVSCDDIEEASRGYVQLTTARLRKSEIGRRAALLLLERIADPSLAPRRVLLAPELMVRQSCGARLAGTAGGSVQIR